MGVSLNGGFPPQKKISSILYNRVFQSKNHPFWGGFPPIFELSPINLGGG